MKKLKGITDKDLMVYLVSVGMEVQNVERVSGANRSILYFEDNDKLKELSLRFTNKLDQVNVADYIATEKRITTLLCLQKG